MKKAFANLITLTALPVAGLMMVGHLSAQIPQQNVTDLERQIQELRQALDDARGPGARRGGIQIEAPASDNRGGGRRGGPTPRRQGRPEDPIERIRDEGLNRSEVMKTLSYLSDVIGGRLTGSPNMKRANEWTRDQMLSWGLTNGNVEPWGTFGRGWELKRFAAQITEPQSIPLKAFPNAWSPGFDAPFEAEVIYLDARNTADLEKYRGKLKGAVVLASPIRPVAARVEPYINRFTEANLLQMANASLPSGGGGSFDVMSGTISGGQRGNAGAPRGDGPGRRGGAPAEAAAAATNAPGARRGGGGARGGGNQFLSFIHREGAALVVNPGNGDGGTIFLSSATVPPADGAATNTNAAAGGRQGGRGAYAMSAPSMPAQITMAAEDYNRLVRIAQAGEKMKMAVDMQVKYYYDDPMAYNTVAEIPGTDPDLKDEIVMLGGHLDSWHSGTGATDNAAGCAVAMEAVRILRALDLKPRRTIRVALWSGEEQGLLGSRAYVSKHFGYFTNAPAGTAATIEARAPNDQRPPARIGGGRRGGGGGGANANRRLVKTDEYDKLSVYFNLDNGGGKIRGVYLQGNEGARPIFRQWLDYFRDLGAETLTPLNTGSTDHVAFDSVGLPGFQFIQDRLDYDTRTHHSNEDVFDRIQADDMKQASTIMAAFVYGAAMLDEKIPRKTLE